MKKTGILIVLILFSILAAVSQDITWEKVYEHGGFASKNPVMDILPLENDGYLLAGTVFYNNAINHQFIRIIKTDTLGEIIWEKLLNMDDENFTLWQQANSIAPTSDGNFLICGVDHLFYEEEKVYFVKINPEGDTLWTKKYPFNNTAKSLKMITLGNDEFIFAGSKKDTNFVHSALLGKIDGDGEILWSQSYFETVEITEALDVKQTNDGGFILCGRNNGTIFLTKTDGNGVESWSKTFNFDGIAAGYSVLQTPDDGFLIGGGHYDLENLRPVILKTNAQGDSLWSSTLSDEQRFVTNMRQSTDGSIGITTAQHGFYNGMHGGFGDFYKIDQNGNIDQHLPLFGQANDLEPGANGCYFIAGSSKLPVSYNEYMYLAKIGDFIDSNKDIENAITAVLFPNPVDHFLQIQISEQLDDLEFQLFDPLGRSILLEQIQTQAKDFSTIDLTNGIYFFTLKTDQKIIQSGKILVQH